LRDGGVGVGVAVFGQESEGDAGVEEPFECVKMFVFAETCGVEGTGGETVKYTEVNSSKHGLRTAESFDEVDDFGWVGLGGQLTV
jgi:hypothetical protein